MFWDGNGVVIYFLSRDVGHPKGVLPLQEATGLVSKRGADKIPPGVYTHKPEKRLDIVLWGHTSSRPAKFHSTPANLHNSLIAPMYCVCPLEKHRS